MVVVKKGGTAYKADPPFYWSLESLAEVETIHADAWQNVTNRIAIIFSVIFCCFPVQWAGVG